MGAVTFDYAITVADLREALRPTHADGRPRRGSVARGLIGWVVFLLMAVLVLYMLAQNGPPGPGPAVPPRPSQSLWVTLVPPLVPSGMAVAMAAVSVVLQHVRIRRAMAAVAANRPAPPPPPRVPPWAVWASISPVALIAVTLVPALDVRWSPTPDVALYVGLLPWLAAMIAVAALLLGAGRRSARWRWAVTPSLRRTLSVDVSDAGVRATDGVCDALYRWPAVVRYRETAGLLVLTLEDARVLILPKRAVPDPADEDALRRTIQQHVAEGSFLLRDRAFPVLPVGPADGR